MIFCSVKYCCSNSFIPGVILHPIMIIMKSIKTPNHLTFHWGTHWPLEVWVRGLYNSWWFCVHKLSMFIYLSMVWTHGLKDYLFRKYAEVAYKCKPSSFRSRSVCGGDNMTLSCTQPDHRIAILSALFSSISSG